MKLTPEGHITIPERIRELAGLTPDTEIEFRYEDGRVWLEKVEPDREAQRAEVMRLLKRLEGSATANLDMSTDEWMRLTRGED